MTAPWRRAAAVLAVALAAAIVPACSSKGGGQSTSDTEITQAVGSPFTAHDLLPLHLESGAHPRIVNSDGGQVLLRGANLNTLGDYYQDDPQLDPTFPYDAHDFADMASLGFDAVRLIVSWSRLEPDKGHIDDHYIQQIHDAVDAAAAQGIYTVIDMHQDAWGKFVASPHGTTCPAGLQPGLGWDGAPEWATITDGASTCNSGLRETAGAVIAAWRNFYADTDGIQSQLVDVWERLGKEFAGDPAVAGYDLLNEPGLGAGVDQSNEALGAFYGRAIDAIRRGESQRGGRRSPHLVFWEPLVLWSGVGDLAVPTHFSDDANLVFAPHLYAESILAQGVDVTIAQGFANAAAKAQAADTTFWVGEYGWFGDPAQQADKVSEYARQEDRYAVGGTWWQWRQACGDPHSIGSPGGHPPHVLVHLHRTRCPSGRNLGLTQPWATTLSRTYPRSAPGHLIRMATDPATGIARIKGSTDATGTHTLVVWVPDRHKGVPAVSGSIGGDAATIVAGDGGYRVELPVEGNYDVRITPSAGVQISHG